MDSIAPGALSIPEVTEPLHLYREDDEGINPQIETWRKIFDLSASHMLSVSRRSVSLTL